MAPGFPLARFLTVGSLLTMAAAPLAAQTAAVSDALKLSVTVVRGCTVSVAHDPELARPAVSFGCRSAKSFAEPVVTTVLRDPAAAADEAHDMVVINF